MINVKKFILELKNGVSYTGVPDSVLKSLINFLSDKYKNSHLTTTSEGSAVSLGIGYNLATKNSTLPPKLCIVAKPLIVLQIKELILSQWLLIAEEVSQNTKMNHKYLGPETTIKNLETFNIKSKFYQKNYVNQIKQTVDNAKKFSKAFALIVPMNFLRSMRKKENKSKIYLKI